MRFLRQILLQIDKNKDYMKNKKNLLNLVNYFVKASPRANAIKRNGILPIQHQSSLNNLPTDEQYIKNFIVHIDCTYMYDYYGPPIINQNKMSIHKNNFFNPMSAGLTRRKSIELNDVTLDKKTVLLQLIKSLNKNKFVALKYVQMQEFLQKMTLPETKQFKKFIIYLYKWLLNEKYQFQPGTYQQQLCQQTSQMIVRKIYEAHEKGDVQLLKKTEEQLAVIDSLQKARQFKRQGDTLKAKQNYQIVYQARMSEENDKIQALNFLCDQSLEEQDILYLTQIIEKIKVNGGMISHEKIVKRALQKIQELFDQKTQINTDQNTNFFDLQEHKDSAQLELKKQEIGTINSQKKQVLIEKQINEPVVQTISHSKN